VDPTSRREPTVTDSYLLEVTALVDETADTRSITFAVPAGLADRFAFAPGQFLTVGIPSARTGLVARCYSLCSRPGEPLTITVRRTPGGYASGWLHDHLAVGDTLRVLPPSGIFTPKDWSADLLLLAAGSGITPIMSILRTALAEHSCRVVLLDANRDERSVIFADALAALADAHPERLTVLHWLESARGLPTEEQLRAFAAPYAAWTSFCCGPAPFMKAVSQALRSLDVPRARRHQERFVSLDGNPFGDVEEVRAARATLAEADDPDDPDEAA
jgi:3-ketosteroid 9alpha-monooxygenase subunit B